MSDREFNSAAVDDPAKVPQGRFDISPLAAVESNSLYVSKCAYCKGSKPPLISNDSWREMVFRKRGFWPKVPVCRECNQQLRLGRVPAELSDADLMVKGRLGELKEKAHWISVKGGSLTQLREIISEVDACSQFVIAANIAFQEASAKAASAASRLEWIQSIIRDATGVVERKTSVSYSMCRRIANRTIGRPEVRKLVFERAGYKCELCGREDFLSIDHVKSVKKGGNNEPENLQCLCLPCNCSKGSKGD